MSEIDAKDPKILSALQKDGRISNLGASINSNFRDEVLGALRAATGMYIDVHEDCEHSATTQFARKTDL